MRTHLFENFVSSVSTKSTGVNPFACSHRSKTCTSYSTSTMISRKNKLPLLSARTGEIQRLNKILMENSGFIDVGWVFMQMEKNRIPRPNSGNGHKYCIIIICMLSAAALLSIATLAIILVGRCRNQLNIKEDPKAVLKNKYASKSFHLQSQYLHEEKMEGSIIKSWKKRKLCCYAWCFRSIYCDY